MRTILRFLLVVPFAFVAACLTSAFTILWPYLAFADARTAADPILYLHSLIAFWAQSAQIGSTVLVPWAIFMGACEILGLASLMLHVAAGVCGSVAIIVLAYGEPAPSGSIQAAIVVSGLVFALTYWVIAGRNAGNWRPLRMRRARRSKEDAASDGERTGGSGEERGEEGETANG